jgi:hypothetical protein
MVMPAHTMMRGGACSGLRRDRFCAVRSSLGIARRLLYAAGSGLRLSCSLLSALAGGFSAGRGLVSAIGGIDRLLSRIGLLRACTEQRKGQRSTGEPYQFRSFPH